MIFATSAYVQKNIIKLETPTSYPFCFSPGGFASGAGAISSTRQPSLG